jgi:hypothetical protein
MAWPDRLTPGGVCGRKGQAVTDSMIPAVEAATEAEAAGGKSMEPVVNEELAGRLVEQARTEGLSLIGPGGCWAT